MRSSRNIQVVSCHAEGEPGDVIVGGVSQPKGDTLWAQSRALEQQGDLRDFLLNEPRGEFFAMRISWFRPWILEPTLRLLSWRPHFSPRCPDQMRFASQPCFWRLEFYRCKSR